MSDAFTPQVRALLDRLEPPALSADFADRLVAMAELGPSLPPLPPHRISRVRRGRRVALAVGVAGLVSMAAAAAVVPADVWRKIPVIGGIVELISPAKETPASTLPESAPTAPAASQAKMPEADSGIGPTDVRPVSRAEEALTPPEDRVVVPRHEPLGTESGTPVSQPDAASRPREPLSQTLPETPAPERPATVTTRDATAVTADTPIEPAPARASERVQATGETRQQVRERTTTTRQSPTRERIERRERRTTQQRTN